MGVSNMIKKYKFFMDNTVCKGRGASGSFLMVKYAVIGVWDFLVYGSTVTDFFELTFYKKSSEEKRRYVTWRLSKKFMEITRTPADELYLNKTHMYREMKKFVKRDQLLTDSCTYDEFVEFCAKHERFLYKPSHGDCGKGIELIHTQGQDLKTLYERVTAGPAVLDQLIVQHPDLQALCATSVNTLRIVTLRIGSEIRVIGAALRIGSGNSVVDNYSAGGLVARIDMETGRVLGKAENMYGNRFERCPSSGALIKGFQIPHWDKALRFVRECAEECGLDYASWDIAILESGCVLIEVNPRGMVNVIQVAGTGGRKQQYLELIDCYKRQNQ